MIDFKFTLTGKSSRIHNARVEVLSYTPESRGSIKGHPDTWYPPESADVDYNLYLLSGNKQREITSDIYTDDILQAMQDLTIN